MTCANFRNISLTVENSEVPAHILYFSDQLGYIHGEGRKKNTTYTYTTYNIGNTKTIITYYQYLLTKL